MASEGSKKWKNGRWFLKKLDRKISVVNRTHKTSEEDLDNQNLCTKF